MTMTLRAQGRAEEITEPGVYDLPPHVYHQDPVRGGSLSSTVARLLVKPGGPALYKYGERRESRTLDFGSLAHLKLLGVGDRICEIDADSFRTAAAREARDAAYERGEVPVLTGSGDLEKADAMVEAIDRDLTARTFLGQPGKPEQTIVWQEQGVWCRALIDYLPDPDPTRPLTVVDYKTTADASSDEFMRSALRYSYHAQADWYLRGLRALGLAPEGSRLLLIGQEKTPPYLPNVIDPLLESDVRVVASIRNDEALAIWRRCRETDEWPGYDVDPEKPAKVPGWWYAEHEELLYGSGEIGAS